MAIVSDLTTETRNWIPDTNRYNLPKPPSWFLKALWDMDAALVLLPSRKRQNVYIIARRRELSLRVPFLAKPTKDQLEKSRGSDSDMLAARQLVFVDVIRGNPHSGVWNPAMLHELKQRDMWGDGGVESFIAKIEEKEAAEQAAQRKTLLDNIDHRARDAWRSLQARTGQRNQHANSRHGQSPRAKIVSVGTL
jgi:hypothetical protein